MTPEAEPDATDAATATVETPTTPDAGPGEGSAVTVRPVAFTPIEGGAEADAQAGPRPLDLILDVQVPIAVELGHTDMAIEDLLALKPGAVLELDKLASEPVDLLIRDHVIAHGEIIVVDDSFGIRITTIIDPTDRVRSLEGE